MKKVLFIILLAFSYLLNAQDDFFRDILSDSTRGAIEISGYASAQSNTLSSEILDKFIFGGFISEEIKSINMIRLRDLNYVNAVIQGKISYYDFKDGIGKGKRFSPFITLNSEFSASAKLTKGTIDLLLNGNKPDTTYNLNSDFLMTYFSQSLSFGFVDKTTKSCIYYTIKICIRFKDQRLEFMQNHFLANNVPSLLLH